jgi:hypothetical protein
MSLIITRLFDNFSDAEHAVIELKRVGVPEGDISLVSHRSDHKHSAALVRRAHGNTAGQAAAKDAAAGIGVGGAVGAAGGVLAGLGLLAIPGLGPVIAAGWLASAAVGALVGGAVVGAAGGVVGALTNAGVSREEAEIYAEGVRRGGTLVSAKVDQRRAAEAQAVLNSLPAVDLTVRRNAYREAGWNRFDEGAGPYPEDAIEAERARWAAR